MITVIAMCEFSTSPKQYEYLCELPDDANPGDYAYAVTMENPQDYSVEGVDKKSNLPRFNVVYIRSFKPLTEKSYEGELNRLVIAFSMKPFMEYALRKQKMTNLRQALERKIAEMSIFDKIKAMNIKDSEISSMADELKKLMENK